MASAVKAVPRISFFCKDSADRLAGLKAADVRAKNIPPVSGGSGNGSFWLHDKNGFPDEDSEDEFFAQMYQRYLDSSDPGKDETTSMEDLAAELGIALA